MGARGSEAAAGVLAASTCGSARIARSANGPYASGRSDVSRGVHERRSAAGAARRPATTRQERRRHALHGAVGGVSDPARQAYRRRRHRRWHAGRRTIAIGSAGSHWSVHQHGRDADVSRRRSDVSRIRAARAGSRARSVRTSGCAVRAGRRGIAAGTIVELLAALSGGAHDTGIRTRRTSRRRLAPPPHRRGLRDDEVRSDAHRDDPRRGTARDPDLQHGAVRAGDDRTDGDASRSRADPDRGGSGAAAVGDRDDGPSRTEAGGRDVESDAAGLASVQGRRVRCDSRRAGGSARGRAADRGGGDCRRDTRDV